VAQPAMPSEGQLLPPPVRTKVIEYPADDFGACNKLTECIGETPQGYRLCLVAVGAGAEQSCPPAWPERHAGWRKAEEKRVCSACACSPPQGGFCEVRVRAFADHACGNERGSLVLASGDGERCVDLMSGTALGSKSAEVLGSATGIYAPSDSEVVGEVETGLAVTYCCLPELTPPQCPDFQPQSISSSSPFFTPSSHREQTLPASQVCPGPQCASSMQPRQCPAPSHTPPGQEGHPRGVSTRWQVPSQSQLLQWGRSPHAMAFSHGQPSPPFAHAGSLHEGRTMKAGKSKAKVSAAARRWRIMAALPVYRRRGGGQGGWLT
jgi:hypothetical protein